jgi:serine/threonine protein phosphatase 1|tara:strand:+ start:6783 stop:7682 length:900 start_codon:yes stop_codon:yes gene_type:complete
MRSLPAFIAFGRARRERAAQPPLPCPTTPVWIVGDLHGRLDLLDLMLARIDADPDSGTARIVFTGDMIDRGPQSAGVLARLYDLVRHDPDRVICLMGNHERMMLDFLGDPLRQAPRWLAAGGGDTLASFGLPPWSRGGGDREKGIADRADALRGALGLDTITWLQDLPLYWQEGRLAVTHAGADPDRPIADQKADTLLWGHNRFLRRARKDGLWVAHGHTVVETAQAGQGRIAVDTGAWRSGCLSAARVDGTGVTFVTVKKPSEGETAGGPEAFREQQAAKHPPRSRPAPQRQKTDNRR